ncbi:MAG: DUF86 domain-containing protein [Bacteroidales bacterium]|nr:DUF86 domain-containing protein [Bacteroidales bacterium]MBR4488714.1 DUF86 domain-containing protein [Bacteroidales bacterium]
MREPIKDKGRLEHILAAIDKIEHFLEGQDFESFSKNEMMYYAVVKNVEIIGEAANMITNDYRDSHPEVEWRSIISMRHVLVHGYYQISKAEVWDTAKINLPPLKAQIEQYISEME